MSLRSKPLKLSNLWLLCVGSCCTGLAARGRREPFDFLYISLRSKPLKFSNLWLLCQSSCCSGPGARGRREPSSTASTGRFAPNRLSF